MKAIKSKFGCVIRLSQAIRHTQISFLQILFYIFTRVLDCTGYFEQHNNLFYNTLAFSYDFHYFCFI